MKMLTRDSNKEYLQSLKGLLEANGIPAVIHGTETARMIIPALHLEPTLWVYLDEQFEDAAKLIINPEYVVTTGIDVDQFYSNQPNPEEQAGLLNKALGSLAAYVVIFIVGMFIVIKILGSL